MLFNIIFFNISWFGLVLSGNSFIPVTLCWIFLHLYLSKQRLAECKLILSVIIIGTVVDSAFIITGVFLVHESSYLPLWLVTLWAAFSLTLHHSLQFLSSKVRQSVVGFIFPPLSYLAGISFSSIELGYSQTKTFLILAIVWSALMMLFFYLVRIFLPQEICHEI